MSANETRAERGWRLDAEERKADATRALANAESAKVEELRALRRSIDALTAAILAVEPGEQPPHECGIFIGPHCAECGAAVPGEDNTDA